jgi:hypothetical protein
MARRLLRNLLVVSALLAACREVGQTSGAADASTGTGSDSDTDTDTEPDDAGPPVSCEELELGDPCDPPDIDAAYCDHEYNCVFFDYGYCFEDPEYEGPDTDPPLICWPDGINCNDVEPPYCDEDLNAVRQREYLCDDSGPEEAHCALVEDLVVEDCDDLAGSSFCGNWGDVYTSSSFTCLEEGYSTHCEPDEAVFAQDCDLDGLVCHEGVCVEPPPCYEAEYGDPCDTGEPEHCEGDTIHFQEGYCDVGEMVLFCHPYTETCEPPLECIEDAEGAHCG